jgi:large subunit ribosomal protein L29
MDMKAKDFRGSTVEELRQKVKSVKKDLFDLNYQRQMGRVDKPSQFSILKRDIAKMLTVIREKELNNERNSAKTK